MISFRNSLVIMIFFLGVSITRNKFGFVQFEKEEEAAACLKAGNITYINRNRVGMYHEKI